MGIWRRLRDLTCLTSVLALAGLLGPGTAGIALAATARAATTAHPAVTAATGAVAWGDNSGGQLGDGTVTGSSTPTGVGNLTGIQAVAAGHRFTLALLANGSATAPASRSPRGRPGPDRGERDLCGHRRRLRDRRHRWPGRDGHPGEHLPHGADA